MMKQFAVVFTAAGFLTAYVASGPSKPAQLAAAPRPSAGQRIGDYQDRCRTQVTRAKLGTTAAEEMVRRTQGMTPYQWDRLMASYEQIKHDIGEAIKRCMEGALYDDPEAAQVLARSRAAVGVR